MRILIDIRLLGKGGRSGVEEYTRQMIKHLLTLDQQNRYIFFYNGLRNQPLESVLDWDDNSRSFAGAQDDNLELLAGINCCKQLQIVNFRVPNKILGSASRFLNWPKIDRLIKTDLIYSPHINLLRQKKTPRILTIHDLSFLYHPYFFSRKHKIWHWLQDVRRQAKEAAKIITISNYSKRTIVETLRIEPEKIEVVYPGVKLKINPPAGRQKSKLLCPCGTDPYILYLGTVEPRKNIEAIISAFDLIKKNAARKNLKLIIAGKRGWLFQPVMKRWRQSPVSQDIIFLGQINDEQKAELYQNARVFVYPSFFEGFGLPPIEAQIYGCPVIASNRTSLPEVLGESALLVDPWEITDLAEAIEKIIDDQKLKDDLISKGWENIKRFDWQNSASRLLEIFQELIL